MILLDRAIPDALRGSKTGEVRRFLNRSCKLVRLPVWLSLQNQKTLFVGVQHPGEEGVSFKPFHSVGIPFARSSVMVITRIDGGVIGA